MFYFFDTTRFPVVVLTINGGPQSDKDMNDFLNAWQSIYILSMQKLERYKLIFDVRQAGMLPLHYLKMMVVWLIKVKELTEKWMDRTAIIVKDEGIRILIQFAFTIYKAQRPFKVFKHVELNNAFNWVNSQDEGDPTNENCNSEELIKQIEQETPHVNFS